MIRTAIVDDHAIVRAGLRKFLSAAPDVSVVGEAATARDALALVRDGGIQVLLLDLAMPGQNGVDVLTLLRGRAPELAILILSGYPEEQYAPSLLRKGASGYLGKGSEPSQILEAIRTVASGRKYMSPAVAALLGSQLAGKQPRARHELLTDREFQVFLKIARGDAVGHIARAMSLSVKTVSTYRARLLAKLELSSNAEVTYYALTHKLLD